MATPSTTRTGGRVYFRDVKPYAVVDSLDQLHGPAGGVIALSHSVLWAPGGGHVDLDEPGGTALAYQAVLAEGLVEDLVHLLNAARLVVAWPPDAAASGPADLGVPVPRASRGPRPLRAAAMT